MQFTEETVARVRLHLVAGIGPQRARVLIARFGSASQAWEEGPSAWTAVAGIGPAIVREASLVTRERAEQEIEALLKMSGWVLDDDSPLYPELMRPLSDRPLILFGLGQWPPPPAIAVVGTRRPTPAGVEITARLCSDLASAGATIVSGMALGIDAAAHWAALSSGGVTVAVLAHGLDGCYPPEHRSLMASIVEQGAVLTEFPLGVRPRAGHFPARNRIIAGMTYGTIVVEAGIRSGAMTTATIAAEYGREVFAVPGDVRRWASRGPHRLLREGAWLTESAEDVWAVLPVLAEAHRQQQRSTGERESVLDKDLFRLLGQGEWSSAEDLARGIAAPPQDVLARLSYWELRGRLEHDGWGRYRLASRFGLQARGRQL